MGILGSCRGQFNTRIVLYVYYVGVVLATGSFVICTLFSGEICHSFEANGLRETDQTN